MRPLARYTVSQKAFDTILYDYEWVVREVHIEDILHNERELNRNVHRIFYDPNKNMMIANYLILQQYAGGDAVDHYMQKCILLRSQSDEKIEKPFVTPYAKTCKKFIERRLLKYYTQEEIEQCLREHSLQQHYKPWHSILPHFYDTEVVHKIHNCVYYDVNNAHLDALIEIFPKAKSALIAIRTQIIKFKKKGLINKALTWKAYVNVYVGSLGMIDRVTGDYASTRGTYEWIVQRTRRILEGVASKCNGEVIYANTDGAIIHNPKHTLETSESVGDVKSEMSGDTVYVYVHRSIKDVTTGYVLYQYQDSKGRTILKGNAPSTLRENIDLSKGLVVNYKQYEENKFRRYSDVRLETKEIVEWQ